MDRRWRDHAFCASGQADPIFWVGEEQSLYALAAHFCRSHCSVLAQCRAEAIARPYRGVVVGGIVWADQENAGPRRSFRRRYVCEICRETVMGK